MARSHRHMYFNNAAAALDHIMYIWRRHGIPPTFSHLQFVQFQLHNERPFSDVEEQRWRAVWGLT